MHTMYQMYSKHQSVSLSGKKQSSNRGKVYLNYYKRGDGQVLSSQFTLNSDLQTYSYTSDCSALLSVLILCSVLPDSCKSVTYFQRDNNHNKITNIQGEQESNIRHHYTLYSLSAFWLAKSPLLILRIHVILWTSMIIGNLLSNFI